VVSCRLSATGIRFSGHPHPAQGVEPSSRSAYRHHRRRTPSGFPRSTLTSYDRVGCLLHPEDGGAHPGPDAVPGQRLPHHSGMSLHPATTSRHGATIHEASTKVHAIHPSGLPLTRDPQAEQGSFGFPLGLRTLPSPATHAKGGARHRAHARNYATDITSALLTASPLAKCDFVSQRQKSKQRVAEASSGIRRKQRSPRRFDGLVQQQRRASATVAISTECPETVYAQLRCHDPGTASRGTCMLEAIDIN
jgi:hypothetical protein